MTHLLPLASLPPAALAVIFGPDGDFEGAPRWDGPVQLGIRWVRLLSPDVVGDSVMIVWANSGEMMPLSMLFLDLRIPSVAARLAGLCARAIPHVPDSAAGVRIKHRRASDIWSLIWVDSGGFTKEASWNGDGTRTHPYDPDLTGAPFHDSASFLASLTISLADRIGALPAGTDPR